MENTCSYCFECPACGLGARYATTFYNVSDKPIRFVSQVVNDPLGGPGAETKIMVMPGHGIDISILGLGPKEDLK